MVPVAALGLLGQRLAAACPCGGCGLSVPGHASFASMLCFGAIGRIAPHTPGAGVALHQQVIHRPWLSWLMHASLTCLAPHQACACRFHIPVFL